MTSRTRRPYGAAALGQQRDTGRPARPVYRISWRWRLRLWRGWARPDWTRNWEKPS